MSASDTKFTELERKIGELAEKALWVFEQIRQEGNPGFDILEDILKQIDALAIPETPQPPAEQ